LPAQGLDIVFKAQISLLLNHNQGSKAILARITSISQANVTCTSQ